jgi:hypothetical protein
LLLRLLLFLFLFWVVGSSSRWASSSNFLVGFSSSRFVCPTTFLYIFCCCLPI